MIRRVKQAINWAVANHIQYLTLQRPDFQDHSQEMDIHNSGIACCNRWAHNQHTESQPTQPRLRQYDRHKPTGHRQRRSRSEEGENILIASERKSLSDQSSDESTNTCSSQSYLNEEHRAPTKNRYYFDKGTHDNLQNIIILKVYSHQLNRDFVVEDSG